MIFFFIILAFIVFLFYSMGASPPPGIGTKERCEGPHKWATLETFFGKDGAQKLREFKGPPHLPHMFCKRCGLVAGTDFSVDPSVYLKACADYLNEVKDGYGENNI